ncbi:AAA family ATPase [Microbacterium gilvum]|uniref:DNA helicase DnaB-like N-terminal domain-containing protein n=1 Tax=Microbacterium gilvum TaxID=1336204 RepID=A0ABP8ZQF2_9MICO
MSEHDEYPPEDPYAPPAPRVDGHALIERQVVGAMLRYPHAVKELQRQVGPSDFSDLRLGAIFGGIVGMAAAGTPVDALTVWDHLATWDVRGIEITDLYSWHDAATTAESGEYLATKVRESSMRRLMADVGARLQVADGDPGVALARATEELRALRDLSVSSEENVRWLREMLNVPEEEDDYDWVIPDVLERQDRALITAGEGVGKSTLIRQMTLLPCAGIHPFTFAPMRPITALVVDAENSEKQWRRKARVLADTAAMRGARDPRNSVAVHTVGSMDITKPNDLGRVHRWIDQAKPDLLVIGPLYMITSGAVNDDDDAKPVLAALQTLRERGVALLIETHSGNAVGRNGDRDLRPIGSSALRRWPEFGLGLREDKREAGFRKTYSFVRWRGDRDRRAWPEKLTRGQVWPWEPTNY